MTKISVLGCGTWGSALAQSLAMHNHNVTMWHYNKKKLQKIKNDRTHQNLPNFVFDSSISFDHDLENAIRDSDFIVVATPTKSVREISNSLRKYISKNQIIVNTSKGLESKTFKRMSEIIIEEIETIDSNNIVTLYGPSHAEEVIKKYPTTLVAASLNLESSRKVQKTFSSKTIRVYTNSDIVGVELGGSLKNVIAIGVGMCDGVGFGDNTKSALITRGMIEIIRLGTAMGARKETFSGLSGIGDLIATCLSKHSRNRFVGESLGKGKKLEDIIASMNMVAEGVETAKSIEKLSKIYNIDMPISNAVCSILFENKDPKSMVVNLMTRDLGNELSN